MCELGNLGLDSKAGMGLMLSCPRAEGQTTNKYTQIALIFVI